MPPKYNIGDIKWGFVKEKAYRGKIEGSFLTEKALLCTILEKKYAYWMGTEASLSVLWKMRYLIASLIAFTTK